MSYTLDIQKLILSADQIFDFNDKVKILKQAIAIADNHNDIDWGFDLRLELIQKERNTSRCTESFMAFAWILNASDTNEGYFDESDFLWEYKWMFCSAYRSAHIPMVQILSIAEDLRERLVKNGYSERAYFNVMTGWAIHLRDYTLAQQYIDQADQVLYDDMSNCPACELDTKVEVLLAQQKIDEALIMARDLIERKVTCFSMPFQTFCCLAYSLHKMGDLRATKYFEMAIDEYHKHDQFDSSVGYAMNILVVYMAETNHPDTWSFFEKIAPWQMGAEDIHLYNFYKFMASILNEQGTLRLKLSSKLPYYKESGIYNKQELYMYFSEQAYGLARVFDKRNDQKSLTQELNNLLNK